MHAKSNKSPRDNSPFASPIVDVTQRAGLSSTSPGTMMSSADESPMMAARAGSLDRRPVGDYSTTQESFLEALARRECQNLPCKRHMSSYIGSNNSSSRTQSSARNDEDGRNRERRRFFVLLEIDSDNGSTSDSEDEYSTEEDVDDNNLLEEDGNVAEDHANDDQGDMDDQLDDPVHVEGESIHDLIHGENIQSHQEISNNFPSSELPSSASIDSINLNYQRVASLLLSLANSEEIPLIRADIPWSLLISCGSMPSLLPALYKNISDQNGTSLLQGVLRMDPPLEAVKVLLDAFPLSCLNMEGFFTACQFAHPCTSRKLRECKYETDIDSIPRSINAPHSDTYIPENMPDNGDDSDHDTDDVGEVVKLVMHQTIRARRLNSIEWGMVAILGDARISPSQAKLLLRHTPEALIDPKHGAFGVSPLDRMMSGVFIHGDTSTWVEKLRLALRVASFVKLRRKQLEQEECHSSSTSIVLPAGFFSVNNQLFRSRESDFVKVAPPPLSVQSFYPYHELIRLLVSPNFQGVKFGHRGFLKTLQACTRADPDAFLRQDSDGNLPIHIALRSECDTVLGVKGERRLIKYLLDLDPNTSLCPEGSDVIDGNERQLPLRLSILNAWPVYDLIIAAAFACCDTELLVTNDIQNTRRPIDYIAGNRILYKPLLHDALNGKYHPRFGIHGARQLVQSILLKIADYSNQQRDQSINAKSLHHLTSLVDENGRTALHISLESKWPVYDLLMQANPNFCLEFRDPRGFLPFQIAACAFTASCPNKVVNVMMSKQCEEREINQSILSSLGEAQGSSPKSRPSKIVPVEGDQEETFLIELSMLYELIRENPLCVTWRMSFAKNSSESRLRSHEEMLKNSSILTAPYLKKRKVITYL
ncbi:hypothetical protein ACHAXA_001063 [Cyclostephanos tholiformis]|uniref:Uncharacterized protein n=1 Tax=Cyclostephanos tholiformis TaxID=382380 RepID=A0ABD3R1A7_9STRA